MKTLRRVVIILLILFVVAQIPFVWRRFQLSSVNNKINELNSNRIERDDADFQQYQGVIHVHTNLGGHSAGTFDELIEAANSNKLDFVIMTEHPSPLYDTARQTLNGKNGGVLFVGGNEISSKQGDRFLLIPGSATASNDTNQSTYDLLNNEKKDNRLALITYPDKYNAWTTATAFDGIEVYSLHTNAKNFNRLAVFGDYFWSFGAFPELTMARQFERPNAALQKFDELTGDGKRLTLFGASDAHSNIGLQLSDRAKHDFIKVQIDRYATIFKLVRLHVLLAKSKELTESNLLEAIKNGNCYMAFDVFGDASGFQFQAVKNNGRKIMGDEVLLSDDLKLSAHAPIKSRFVLYREGIKVQEFADTNYFELNLKEKGVYRVEVHLDAVNLIESPWIISNPIYVR